MLYAKGLYTVKKKKRKKGKKKMLWCSTEKQSCYGLGHPVMTVLLIHNRSKNAVLRGVSPKKTPSLISSPRTKESIDSCFLTYLRILHVFFISFFSTSALPSNQQTLNSASLNFIP